MTTEEMKAVATNLRRMCSDPSLKKNFPSATRKKMNDLATEILDCLKGVK